MKEQKITMNEIENLKENDLSKEESEAIKLHEKEVHNKTCKNHIDIFDDQGRLVYHERGEGFSVWDYDSFGRVVFRRSAGGEREKITYNSAGHLTLVETSTGKKEVFSYTKDNQMKEYNKYQDGKLVVGERMSYDSQGRQVLSEMSNGTKTEYTYEEDDTYTQWMYTDGKLTFKGRATEEGDFFEEYDYEEDGSYTHTQYDDGEKTITRTYDERGNLIKEEDEFKKKLLNGDPEAMDKHMENVYELLGIDDDNEKTNHSVA